jgi:hypothetical protein
MSYGGQSAVHFGLFGHQQQRLCIECQTKHPASNYIAYIDIGYFSTFVTDGLDF